MNRMKTIIKQIINLITVIYIKMSNASLTDCFAKTCKTLFNLTKIFPEKMSLGETLLNAFFMKSCKF